MKVTVDSREKRTTLKLLTKLKIDYDKQALPAGDFETDECVAERKTVKDLVGSIQGTKTTTGRFFDQMRKLAVYCHENDKVPFLFVSGSLKETAEWFESRGLKLNKHSVMGALASATVRYGVHIFAQFSDDEEMLYCMNSVFEKVRDGKYMLPHREQLVKGLDSKTSLWCTILRTQPRIAKTLIKKYESLEKFLSILRSKPSELELIYGVGSGTVNKWKHLLE